jgi:hypothetical protein
MIGNCAIQNPVSIVVFLDLRFPHIDYMRGSSMFKMDIIVPYSFDSCVLTHSAISHHTLVNKKVQKCSLNKYITPKDRKELNDSESMLDMDVILVESYTSLFYPLDREKWIKSAEL